MYVCTPTYHLFVVSLYLQKKCMSENDRDNITGNRFDIHDLQYMWLIQDINNGEKPQVMVKNISQFPLLIFSVLKSSPTHRRHSTSEVSFN